MLNFFAQPAFRLLHFRLQRSNIKPARETKLNIFCFCQQMALGINTCKRRQKFKHPILIKLRNRGDFQDSSIALSFFTFFYTPPVPSGKIFRMDMRESKAAFPSARPAEQPSCRERAHGRFSPQLKSSPDNVIKKAAQDVNMLNGYRTPNAAKKLKTALHGPDHRSLRLPVLSCSCSLTSRVLRLSRTPDASCHLPAKSSFPLPHFVCGSVFLCKVH